MKLLVKFRHLINQSKRTSDLSDLALRSHQRDTSLNWRGLYETDSDIIFLKDDFYLLANFTCKLLNILVWCLLHTTATIDLLPSLPTLNMTIIEYCLIIKVSLPGLHYNVRDKVGRPVQMLMHFTLSSHCTVMVRRLEVMSFLSEQITDILNPPSLFIIVQMR